MPIRLVFFGNERLATGVTTTAPVLSGLIESGYDIAAVVANHHSAGSRKSRDLEISQIARDANIPVWLPARPSDLAEQLTAARADIGVLIAYGRIIPQEILELFPNGIINLHPSLLPLHRGPTPIESVILNGSQRTGVSIMQLASEMDAGPVWAQQSHLLSGTESKQELADSLLSIGRDMMLETLPKIFDQSIAAQPQDSEHVTVDSLITKADGRIVWSKSADRLEREIRAYLGWPGSTTTLADREVIITAASVDETAQLSVGQVASTRTSLVVGTSKSGLKIERLKPAGKREMSATEFVAGIPELR